MTKTAPCLLTHALALLLSTGVAFAQQQQAQQQQRPTQSQQRQPSQQPSQEPAPAEATRPATPTVAGDTGLWWVPSAEILPHGR
ncbi:MAG TPA: hypothetical protein VNK92_02335, partial [Vicinamibacterales bacterium]|nr:hypothetical protein [Vicinamibacterales bacterium]